MVKNSMQALFARILAAVLVIPLGVAIFGATPCLAQFGNGPGGMAGAGRPRGGETPKPQVAPPPVLPGTKAAPEAAAPIISPADLSPTEALFDAINRGDASAARDAANRGADLNGRNILGLTPLELSVDLGRNDISFMLLSMRDGDSASRTMARNGTELGGTDAGDGVSRTGAARRLVRRARVSTSTAAAAEDPAAETPRLYSGNGGTPIPAAGFLGFGEGRVAR